MFFPTYKTVSSTPKLSDATVNWEVVWCRKGLHFKGLTRTHQEEKLLSTNCYLSRYVGNIPKITLNISSSSRGFPYRKKNGTLLTKHKVKS
jgi:hypothetical protein